MKLYEPLTHPSFEPIAAARPALSEPAPPPYFISPEIRAQGNEKAAAMINAATTRPARPLPPEEIIRRQRDEQMRASGIARARELYNF